MLRATTVLFLGLVCSLLVEPQWHAWIWVPSLLWMGAACTVNERVEAKGFKAKFSKRRREARTKWEPTEMNMQTLRISGMTCDQCVKSIEEVLAGVAGVVEAKVPMTRHCLRQDQ